METPITPMDARRDLDSDRQLAVIDVREPLDYTRGHVREATPVPRRQLEFRLPAVVPNETATVVLCDQHGERAHLDAAWVEELGYEDVTYIEGGMDAWERAGLDTIEAHDGVYGTAFNFPSKEFGEKVQAETDVECLGPDELRELFNDEDEDVLVADVRTADEHSETTIPGAFNIEGVDLGLYLDRLRDDDQPVVVHCAGRTRSIIGTASLKKLGFDNVYELENGTMGWDLAGYELEHGAERHVRAMDLDAEHRAELRSKAEALLEENDVPLISPAAFQTLLENEDAVVYPVDVRTREEYERRHVPDTLSIPGGQAIQTADEHFAVRNGTIVFISNDHIRAAITAYWFSEMGFPNVTVLEAGLEGWQRAGLPVETGRERTPPLRRAEIEAQVTAVSPSEVAAARSSAIIDIDTSEWFKRGHVPDARWVPRYELEGWLEESEVGVDEDVVLTCRHGDVSLYAAAAIQHTRGYENVRVLEGGTAAWETTGHPIEDGTDGMEFEPRDQVPRPYEQDDQAKRAYLEWEAELGEKYTSE